MECENKGTVMQIKYPCEETNYRLRHMEAGALCQAVEHDTILLVCYEYEHEGRKDLPGSCYRHCVDLRTNKIGLYIGDMIVRKLNGHVQLMP